MAPPAPPHGPQSQRPSGRPAPALSRLAQGVITVLQGYVLFESRSTAWEPTSPEGSKWPSAQHRPGLELPNPGHTYLQHLLPPPLSKKPSWGCTCGCSFWLPLWKMAPPKSPRQGQQEKVNGQDWGVSYPKSRPSDYFKRGFIDLLGLKEAAFFLFHYICMGETSCCFCI